jgi:hypothetical protein
LTARKNSFIILNSRRSGEIGIRTRLKIWRSQGHVGSSPTSGIQFSPNLLQNHAFFVI